MCGWWGVSNQGRLEVEPRCVEAAHDAYSFQKVFPRVLVGEYRVLRDRQEHTHVRVQTTSSRKP